MLLVGLMAARPAEAQTPARQASADDIFLSGSQPARAGEAALLQAEEPENRIESKLAPGSVDLFRLFGVSRFDAVEESLAKREETLESRAALEGQSAAEGGQFGLGTLGRQGFASQEPEIDPEQAKADEQIFRMVSSGFLEVDVDRRSVVSSERSEVNFSGFKLTADRMRIDVDNQVIEAAGEVIFQDANAKGATTGSMMVYDFGRRTGWMADADSKQTVIRLGAAPNTDGLPNLLQANERANTFLDSWFTTNNFKRPAYRIQGTELVYLQKERLFIHHAVLYVRDYPLFYFPVYTVYLGPEMFPWSVRVGGDNGGARELGYYGIVSYDYYHRVMEPSLAKPGAYETRSSSRFTPSYWYTEKQGDGVQFDGSYDFNHGQHRGEFDMFYASEHDDRADAGIEEDDERYWADFKHRTDLGGGFDLLINADWISDSEVYADYRDKVIADLERGRVSERRALTALTWRQDDYLARVRTEVKERLGRDRINNYGEPGDDDDDFGQFVNDQPLVFNEETGAIEGGGVVLLEDEVPEDLDEDEEQVNRERFARVTERRPEFDFMTSRLPLFNKPVFWSFDLRAYENLDKGLNTLGEDDDAFVQGFDAYNSLVYVVNFSEQYSWYNRAGFGIGRAERDSYDFGYVESIQGLPEDFEPPIVLPNGLAFADREDTIIVGDEELNLKDVEEDYWYADYESSLNAKFSEKLEGRLRYRIREGEENTLGEFYTRLGATEVRDDLFDYRLRQHKVDGTLTYDFIYPRVKTGIDGGYNLEDKDDYTPSETLSYLNGFAEWKSLSNEWTVTGNTGYSSSQVRSPGAEFAYEAESWATVGQVEYYPLHERFWVQLRASYFKELSQDPVDDFVAENIIDPNLGENQRFDEDDEDWQIEPIYGFKVGPKYEVELQARYDEEEEDFDRIRLIVQRDLNDAVMAVGFQWDLKDQNDESTRDDDDDRIEGDEDYEREMKITWGLSFKLPNRDRFQGPLATEMIVSQRRSEIELGG